MTATTRRIANATISVARDSTGDVDMGDYLDRLKAAVRALPGVTEDTDVNVFASDVTRYEGLYEDSQPWQYDALTNELNAVAETVWSEMCAGR